MTPNVVRLTVGAGDNGLRLDRFCAQALADFSRSRIQKLNDAGGITVGGTNRSHSYVLSAGEVVEIVPDLLTDDSLTFAPPQGQMIPVPVVYVDEHVIVVNKPAGLVVHPAHGHRDGTLVNALLGLGYPLASIGLPDRPGVVHRLDRDTSGVMVLARTDAAHHALVAGIKTGDFTKTYHAIAWGHLGKRHTRVDAPIARHPVRRQEMAIVPTGRPARSELLVVDRYSHFDYIRVSTETGRTHQIRVHLTHIGHPILGDPVYRGRKPGRKAEQPRVRATFDRLLKILPRHALHATRLSFTHPVTGDRMTFTTALPADMRLALETLYREDRTKEVAG